jgi:hypothetical protein
VAFRRPLPGEEGRSPQALLPPEEAFLLALGKKAEGLRPGLGIPGGKEKGGVSGHLGERPGPGGDDRHPGGHGLEKGETESLIEGGEGEEGGGGVEEGHLLLGEEAEKADPPLPGGALHQAPVDLDLRAGQDQVPAGALGAKAEEADKSLEEQGMVFSEISSRYVKDVAGRKAVVVPKEGYVLLRRGSSLAAP